MGREGGSARFWTAAALRRFVARYILWNTPLTSNYSPAFAKIFVLFFSLLKRRQA
jgi:hypothetical protein